MTHEPGKQAVLYGLPYETEEERTLSDKFVAWVHSAEGSVAMEMFCDMALDAYDAGVKKIGAKAIWERLRWNFQVEKRLGDKYKLDNSLVSRAARIAILRHPELASMFEFRTLRSK